MFQVISTKNGFKEVIWEAETRDEADVMADQAYESGDFSAYVEQDTVDHEGNRADAWRDMLGDR